MEHIAANIVSLRSRLSEKVSVVAVSKTRKPDEILEAYGTGQRLFGENRVQELTAKQPVLPADIQWHLIGHLQTNKVKQVVPVVSMIQSVDSLRLLRAVNAEAAKCCKVMDCLLQVHIAKEETKSGFDTSEIEKDNWHEITSSMSNIRVRGLMGIATFTDDEKKVREEFRMLASLFKSLRNRCFPEKEWFDILSMGMSADWKVAVEEGSNMIRVGTIIFGERIYK